MKQGCRGQGCGCSILALALLNLGLALIFTVFLASGALDFSLLRLIVILILLSNAGVIFMLGWRLRKRPSLLSGGSGEGYEDDWDE